MFSRPSARSSSWRCALAAALILCAHAGAAAQVWKGSTAPPPKTSTPTKAGPKAPPRAATPRPASRPAARRAEPVTFQYRVLKVGPDGMQLEVNPITVFKPGDRIRFGFKASEDGYVHVIRQRAPDRPGQILLPDARINGGLHRLRKGEEFVAPSGCAPGTPAWACTYPVDIGSAADLYTIVFSRDPAPDFPADAEDENGDLTAHALRRHWAASRQRLSTEQRGDTIFSRRVSNLNPRADEIIIRYPLNKAGRKN